MTPAQITCAICNRPVERLEWWDEHISDERVLRAYCHGAVDSMRLRLRQFSVSDLDALNRAPGVAFSKQLIEGQDA